MEHINLFSIPKQLDVDEELIKSELNKQVKKITIRE